MGKIEDKTHKTLHEESDTNTLKMLVRNKNIMVRKVGWTFEINIILFACGHFGNMASKVGKM